MGTNCGPVSKNPQRSQMLSKVQSSAASSAFEQRQIAGSGRVGGCSSGVVLCG
jgi:hypothetical protein